MRSDSCGQSGGSLLVELEEALQLSAQVIAGVHSVSAIGAASDESIRWLRGLPNPLPAGFGGLQRVADESCRRHYHLLLSSRAASLRPLLQWWRDRQLAPATTTATASATAPGTAMDGLPPLRLDREQRAALRVCVRHYSDLLRLVLREFGANGASLGPSDSASSRSVAGLLSSVSAWLAPQRPEPERPSTSLLGAFDLWVRLMDTADLMTACVPIRSIDTQR